MGGVEGGCGLLVLVGLLGLLLLPLLPTLLGLLFLLAVLLTPVLLLSGVLQRQNCRRLRRLAASAEQRFGGQICRIGDAYAELSGLSMSPAGGIGSGSRMTLQLRLLEAAPIELVDGPKPLQLSEQRRELAVSATQIGGLASTGGFGRFLETQGITMVGELSVEARAIRAAFQCLQERDWAEASQARLREMIAAAVATLAKARGNELLEPSIPQLQRALRSFEAELQKLQQHRHEADAMLHKLNDFLNVPLEIRPILSFDLVDLFDPSRLEDLRASFAEVVHLNDSYRELGRDRLA